MEIRIDKLLERVEGLEKRVEELEEEQEKDKAQLAYLTGFIKGLEVRISGKE